VPERTAAADHHRPVVDRLPVSAPPGAVDLFAEDVCVPGMPAGRAPITNLQTYDGSEWFYVLDDVP
jgi:hypothetical protein